MIPSIQPYLPAFFILFSLLQASQFTWTILQYISNNLPLLSEWRNTINETTNAHSITVSAVMLCFDTLVTSVYIFYLRSMTPDLPDVTKLKIISRYGIASCICMEAWLIGIVLFNYWFVSPSVDVSWFLVSLRAYDLGPAVYLFLQLAMKWSLVREEVRGEKVKRERVETARLVSRRGTVGQVVSTTSESMEKSRSSRAPATLSQA
ncbi:hypothetical protein BCR33DRAFT_713082 [Rhizoclosmatium globosum]|uniref:Uncharacterized protein n=1 Tax=Rhizoclosmatium globosum TaxID=329046 RepID=A0A1Y2CTA1_9FUNG|nr:hypothetical protein BCR33DRAFT_713082 [Rhizoclosmatium globosum]|eukprot:ORY50251.1 hypothetical protein BCR33DRAFT_713082 [Rhizoclosmatium globosum]